MPDADPQFITTREAAALTNHASGKTFLRWAKHACPDVLIRPPSAQGYQVDRGRLLALMERHRLRSGAH